LVTVSTKILSGTELTRVIWERRCYHHGRIVVIGLTGKTDGAGRVLKY